MELGSVRGFQIYWKYLISLSKISSYTLHMIEIFFIYVLFLIVKKWVGGKCAEVLSYIKPFFCYVCQQRGNPDACSNTLRIFLPAYGGYRIYCPNREDMRIVEGWFKGQLLRMIILINLFFQEGKWNLSQPENDNLGDKLSGNSEKCPTCYKSNMQSYAFSRQRIIKAR